VTESDHHVPPWTSSGELLTTTAGLVRPGNPVIPVAPDGDLSPSNEVRPGLAKPLKIFSFSR